LRNIASSLLRAAAGRGRDVSSGGGIIRAPARAAGRATEAGMSRLVEAVDADRAGARGYLERVAKYVPAEIVAAYLTMNGFIGAADPPRRPALYLFSFGAALACTPAYLAAMAKPGQSRGLHLAVSTLAFIVWAYSLDGAFREFALYDPVVSSLALVVFTLLSGLFAPAPGPGARHPAAETAGRG
jgi:hypothetical protein